LGGTALIRPETFKVSGFFVFLIIERRKCKMKNCTGKTTKETVQISDIKEKLVNGNTGFNVTIEGFVHKIRDFKDCMFIVIRTREGYIQVVNEGNENNNCINDIKENMIVKVNGIVAKDDRAPNGFEIKPEKIIVISSPADLLPISLNKKKLNLTIDNNLNLRALTLRHQSLISMFKIQEGIGRGFRDFLYSQQFTEIRSPKIVNAGAEGGSNIFKLDYFDQKAFLAQSPQFYKQTMVGIYERVFETGPVFRAEKHNTVRHLNEYTSLDFEMGFIDDFTDIMEMETAMLKYVFNLLITEYGKYLDNLEISLSVPEFIPCVRFDDAKEMISKKYNRKIKDPYDLQPEEEQLIGELFKEETGSDFVFVTHYPSKKRPFYAMDDPQDTRFTLSFDLLYKGLEITTGGQRIHDYQMQVDKMISKGLDPADFESYLMIHKYGMPPHGGLGIGLERLTMQMTGESNIRSATMFPRDRTRLVP